MSDTTDAPGGPVPEGPVPQKAAVPPPEEMPTVDVRGRPGRVALPRIEMAPPGDFSRAAPGGAAVPSGLADHPRYRVLGVLGQGGMGTVYKAEHRVMKRAVALKVISAQLVASPSALERFRREVQAAARLSHPNVVTAYDAEQAGECHFLVMELVDGISLDRVLQRKGPLPVAFACDYARQAALGLQHAHEHGMVHRDVKPANLMLTRRGQVKVLDFGLARFASEAEPGAPLTECGSLAGTPDYMAPEQAENARGADIRADVYSLGCTLYHLLAGQPPFPEGNSLEKVVAHVKKEPQPLTAFRSDLPAELVEVVGRMMAKDPAARFQTPAEAARALLEIRKAVAAPPVEPPPTAADVPLDPEGIAVSPREPNPGSAETLAVRPSRSRPSRRRQRREPRGRLALLAVAIAVGLSLLILGGFLAVLLTRDRPANRVAEGPSPSSSSRAAEGQGEVSVASGDPGIQLAVRHGAEVIGTLNLNANPRMTLPAGDYRVEVVGGAPELRGMSAPLSLARGERKVAEVRREGIVVQDARPGWPPPPGHPGGPIPPRPDRPPGG